MKYLLLAMLMAVVVVAACKPQEQPPPTTQPQPECTTDADCATAGCSGQLCVKASEAEGIITTCEFREEYSCLRETSCGCVEGKCSWRQTSEYEACLKGISG